MKNQLKKHTQNGRSTTDGVTDLTAEDEGKMYDEFTTALITDFPEFTPFWNMSRKDGITSKKIDVILGGMETIGSS